MEPPKTTTTTTTKTTTNSRASANNHQKHKKSHQNGTTNQHNKRHTRRTSRINKTQSKPVSRALTPKMDSIHFQHKIEIKQLKSHASEGLIGGSTTILALKNTSSYLIASCPKVTTSKTPKWSRVNCLTESTPQGLKLYESGAKVYQGSFPLASAALLDALYIPDFKSYFLCYDSKIYRKDVDAEPPYLWMDLDIASTPGNCLVYSRKNKKLLVGYKGSSLSVLNLRTRRIEVTAPHGGVRLNRFSYFGRLETRLLSATDDFVDLDRVNYSQRRIVLLHRFFVREMLGLEAAGVVCGDFSACPKQKFLLIFLKKISGRGPFGGFFVLLGVSGDRLSVVARMESSLSPRMGLLANLACMGYTGYGESQLVFIGLEKEEEGRGCEVGAAGRARMVIFDEFNHELEETVLGEKSGDLGHGEFNPYRVQLIRGALYYTGCFGKVFRLKIV